MFCHKVTPLDINFANCARIIVLTYIMALLQGLSLSALETPAYEPNSSFLQPCLASIVILSLCPEHREWHLRLPQDQDRSLILKVHTRSAGRPGGQRHRAERPCSVLGSNIDRDDDLAGTPL